MDVIANKEFMKYSRYSPPRTMVAATRASPPRTAWLGGCHYAVGFLLASVLCYSSAAPVSLSGDQVCALSKREGGDRYAGSPVHQPEPQISLHPSKG